MYKFLLCSRYLRTRYIALASIISVMLGVATMIVVNSVMAGFSTEMRDRIHGILADVVLETLSLDGEYDPELVQARIREAAGDYIEAMTPTVEVYGMISFKWVGQYITRPVTLIGIEPASKSRVGTLKENLENYKPVLDDEGQQVRPAALSMDAEPDWELIPEFLQYRQQRLIQQRWLNGGDEDAHDPEPKPLADAAHTAAKNQDASADEAAKDVTPDAAGPVDPFGKAEFVEADLSQPLPARAYVGKGLVSYQHEQKPTGRLQTKLMVQPGDDIKLSTVNAAQPPSALHFNATVVDLFQSGMSEYDQNLVFVNLDYLQKARGMVHPGSGARAITTVQIKLKDYKDADTVVERLRAAFPPGRWQVRTWEQKQGPLLAAVAVESAILNVLLFLIIAVAGFGILAIFYMIVVEKTRDIGILKALGASSSGVMMVFLSYGLGLGIVGSGVGVVLGLLFVRYINVIEHWLTWLTGVEVFDERIYYFPTIPTHTDPLMVAWVALGAMAIAVLASILPARRAAGLRPVEALRYE